jgi:hypothetical protein
LHRARSAANIHSTWEERANVRAIIVGALSMAAGAAGASLFWSRSAPNEPVHDRRPAVAARTPTRVVDDTSAPTDDSRSTLERQVLLLTAKVVDEAAKRQRLEEQVAQLTAQLALLGGGSHDTAGAQPSKGEPGTADRVVAAAGGSGAPDTPASSAMERALIAAGIDASTAADMKRRQDDLAMAEIYLRDQATREQWLDSPRFRDELAAIEAQRVSVRDEIGDDAYDRYLFAQGQTNRVRVDDVMLDSVAAEAGLQTGDIVLRYGDDRIFSPEELVNATRGGRAGEAIRLEIIRNGARVEVQVPRGPLGLRIAATQSEPTS